jgi:predicted nucleic-acid-binding protein
VIAVDTNILARFYCEDPDDPQARSQRPRARRLILESPAVFVPLTVVLELEWVMRGFYGTARGEFCNVIDHLLGMDHVTVERWEAVKDAADLHRRGLDFADALHWVCSASCDGFVTFDDRRFARRAKGFKRTPQVRVPGA